MARWLVVAQLHTNRINQNRWISVGALHFHTSTEKYTFSPSVAFSLSIISGAWCQESESLSDFKNRRAGRPDFN
jgi:hypothetical protein